MKGCILIFRTNLPKEIMLFPGFPFEDRLASFPRHNDVLSYLEKYTERYNLNRFIEFRKPVEQVSPIPLRCSTVRDDSASKHRSDGCVNFDSVKWKVTTCNLTTREKEIEECDFVIMCNG